MILNLIYYNCEYVSYFIRTVFNPVLIIFNGVNLGIIILLWIDGLIDWYDIIIFLVWIEIILSRRDLRGVLFSPGKRECLINSVVMILNSFVIIFNDKQVCHPIRAQSTRLDTNDATRPIRFRDATRYTRCFEIANSSSSDFQVNVQTNVHDAVSRIRVNLDKSAFITRVSPSKSAILRAPCMYVCMYVHVGRTARARQTVRGTAYVHHEVNKGQLENPRWDSCNAMQSKRQYTWYYKK